MKKMILLGIFFTVIFSHCSTRKNMKALWKSPYNIEIETLGVGHDGSKLVKAWANARNPELAVIQAEKNAVAAAIFKGLPGGNGSAATPAICPEQNKLEKNASFFEEFFETGGKYLQFITLTNDGMPGGKDRIRMSSGYKVGVKATLAYNNLREYLEKEGLANPMDQGF